MNFMKHIIVLLLVFSTVVLMTPNAFSQYVPEWVKNTAGWWATDAISETEFVNAISYLIKVGIINIESDKSPELIAEMWINGHINDDEFLVNVDRLIETNRLSIPVNHITPTSQIPDWLLNNAGWWTARIITNSDFNFDPDYTDSELYPCIELSTDTECFIRTYNSYSFRGAEFEKVKEHDIDFRIFAVGGSTTFGAASDDVETWPAHLQKIINEEITNQKIQVINAGMSGGVSESNYDLIKNKLSALDPDLIIIYEGWNDSNTIPTGETIRNWESTCELGNSRGFDTIILVQAMASTGNRVMTVQEMTNSYKNFSYLQNSQQYVDAFEELDDVCTKAADFRRIFDYVQEPVFWDGGHMTSFGNQIVAKNVFSLISPIYFDQKYSVTHNESGTGVVYAVGADLSGKNFDNLNLQNAVFDKADLSNTSFKNANIDGARFAFANLDNSDLFDKTDLSNVNLTGVDLQDTSLKGKDLSGANLSYVDLSEHDLSGANLSDTFLLRTDLSGIDLRTIPLTDADFRYSNLSGTKLPDSLLVNNHFEHATLSNIDFAGKNLSGSRFNQIKLDGSDMQDTNLTGSIFVQVDFTKIKNKSLAGSNLTGTSLAHSNLSDVNISDVVLDINNFWNANLSGVDFTVVSDNNGGSNFFGANLSNSNFEGVDLSPKEVYTTTFKNKAYLKAMSTSEIIYTLFGDTLPILMLYSEVSGNDLILSYVIYNTFPNANLENANFKNASLQFVNFYSADLINADLSGADLTKSYLANADLTGANLTDAILTDAELSEGTITAGTILNCIGHPICLSE